MNNLIINKTGNQLAKLINLNIKNSQDVDKLKEISINFINATEAKYRSADFSDEIVLKDVKDYIERFVKKNVKGQFDRWTIRKSFYNLLSDLNLNIEDQNIKKIIFILFTDSISENIPESTPLIFWNNDQPIVKRHPAVLEFDLYPNIIEGIINLNPERKHQLVIDFYPDDLLLIEGISKYLAVMDYFIFNLFEKILFHKVILEEQIVYRKEGKIILNQPNLQFVLESIFLSLLDVVSGEKTQIPIVEKSSKNFIKIKNFIKRIFKDENELEYLKLIAVEDERTTENRSALAVDYSVQENVFKEAVKREGVSEVGKIEAPLWLIGLSNLKLSLLVRYFDGDFILEYIQYINDLSVKDKFNTEFLKSNLKTILKKLFEYPYLSKNYKNKELLNDFISETFKDDLAALGNYFYFTRQYEKFNEISKTIENKDNILNLKTLLAKFYTDEISKEELINWLSLMQDETSQFFYHLLNNSLDNYEFTNYFKYVIDLYKVRASHQEIFQIIGEEQTYEIILKVIGIYPYDKTLLNLADIKFDVG
jgi:hypothetical protein